MKKFLLMLLCLAMCLVPACYGEESEAPALEPFSLGDTVPDFSVTLEDGSVFTLSEALSTHDVVMINIWATWCNPCCAEFPYMESAYNQYADRVALVCLSPFDDNESITAFKAEQGLNTLPMGYDAVGMGDILVQEGYPTTIIVDKFGCYAYYECGSMQSEGQFTRMFDYFLSEDYTESQVVYTIPGAKPTVENPTALALTAAGTDGTVSLSCDEGNAYAWPFVITDNGLVSSNTEYDTAATLLASVTANDGDVFAFDYAMDTETMCGLLEVYVDDVEVTAFTGGNQGTYGIKLTAGDHTVSFNYTMYGTSSAEVTDTATLSNIRLVSGEAGDAIIAALPVYTRTLEGNGLQLEFYGDNMKEIVFDDPEGLIAASFGDARYYVANADSCFFSANIGESVIPQLAFVYGDYDGNFHFISGMDYGTDGYCGEIALSSVEQGGYCNTYVYLYDNYLTGENYTMAVVFVDEPNVNYFLAVDCSMDGVTPYECAWHYVDGTEPSTTEIASEATEEEAPIVGGMYTYTISCVDENGQPVTGVMVNVCTDENCTPGMVDENGQHIFEGALYPYSIHVLKVPEGYSFDTSTEFTMDGTELTIVIPHA